MARKKNISDEGSQQHQQQQAQQPQHHHQPHQHQQSRYSQQHRAGLKQSRRNNNSYLEDDDNYPSFLAQLEQLGLEIRDIPGDGNCLFRALGDQLDGSDALHMKHRADVCQYMLAHKDDFAPFVDDSISFHDYIRELARPGTYAGNDAIVAFARLHKLSVVIHQLASPPWQIGGLDAVANVKQLHLAYHNGEHYSSIRRLGDRSAAPANVSIKFDQSTPITGVGKTGKSSPLAAAAAAVASTSLIDNASLEPNSAELNSLVSEVANRTGCKDVELIAESLRELQFDPDETTAYVFQVLESVVADESGVNSEPANLVSQQQQQQHNSNRHHQRKLTKRDSKLLKKERAFERHRRKLLQSGDGDADGLDDGAVGSVDSSAILIQAGSPLLQL